MNPFVAAAMEQVRSGRPVTQRGCIAIIADAKSESEWPSTETYRLQYEGMVQRAKLLGYRTECFFLQMADMTAKSINHILYSRGILGVILAAPASKRASLDLSWDRYAAVAISSEYASLSLNRVSSNHWYNVHKAYTELTNRGYERIGLALPTPKNNGWLGAYLGKVHDFSKARQIPVFVGSPRTVPMESFRLWYEKWRPDALLCLLGEEWEWMTKLGLSPQKELGLVCLNRPLRSKFSGMEENNFLVGEIASSVVINHIRDNDRGLPSHPLDIFVEGTWQEGETLPARRPENCPRRK